jgi:hypothetical protein
MEPTYEYALTSSLSVSFQRYPYPAAGYVTGLATSWGALPYLGTAPQTIVVPCPVDEAFWIGLVLSPPWEQHRLQVRAFMASGTWIDAVTGAAISDSESGGGRDVVTPPQHGIAGIFRTDRTWWAFGRHGGETSCGEIELRCNCAVSAAAPAASSPCPERLPSFVRVKVVDPQRFQALGGIAVPELDKAHRYGGWRLP